MHNLSNCAPRSEWDGGSSARYQLRARMVPKQPMIFQSGVPSKRSRDDMIFRIGSSQGSQNAVSLRDGVSKRSGSRASLSTEGILIASLRNIDYGPTLIRQQTLKVLP